jgi:hypothetical protein
MRKVYEERKIFCTKDGALGIGPAFLRPSDIVCVLQGGSAPYVFRSTPGGDYYYLVGECFNFYLHGT